MGALIPVKSWTSWGIAGITGLLLGLGCCGAPAVAQSSGASGAGPDVARSTDSRVRELIRKSEAKEAENGFCTGIGWPPGDMETYRQFLERAATGTSKVNTFKDRKNCQYDRVEVAFKKGDIACVSYTWWACAGGGTCARGAAIACKNRQGTWDTQNSN